MMKSDSLENSKRISLREINRLALPAILTGISEPLIALVDTAMIGRVGTEALAGIGLGSSLFLFFVWLLTQLRTAISAMVSQHFGSGRLDELKNLVPQSVYLNVVIGLVVLIASLPFANLLLSLYGAEGEVLALSSDYYRIRAWGFPVVLATFTIFGIFRGMQNTAWAMTITLTGGLVNLILDYLLIFGWKDVIEPMGVEGAALASFIAQLIMLSLAIFILLRKTPFNLKIVWQLDPRFGELLKMGAGFFVRVIALYASIYLANRFATKYGDAHIAAHTIAYNIWLFSAYFIDGYANAGNALGGRLLGASRHKELYRLGMRLMWMSVAIGSFLSLIYCLLMDDVGDFFSTDIEVVALFNSVFWLVIITQPINAVAFSFDGIFKGMGRSTFLMVNLLSATILGFIPALIILDHLQFGLHAIWWAFLIFMIIRGGILLIQFVREFGYRSGG